MFFLNYCSSRLVIFFYIVETQSEINVYLKRGQLKQQFNNVMTLTGSINYARKGLPHVFTRFHDLYFTSAFYVMDWHSTFKSHLKSTNLNMPHQVICRQTERLTV